MGDNAKKKIMAGQRFGRWTVMDKYEITSKNEKKWFCRCDCGTERYVQERSLKYGGSLSCGCLRKEKVVEASLQDLTGKTFGDLTVLKRVHREDRRGAWWLCKCSCGQEYEVMGTMLITKRRTHCSGDAHTKNYAFVDITGQHFEHLTALYPLKRKRGNRSVIWHCRCDCGNEIDVSYNELLYSNLKSCGCQKKIHSQNLRHFLTHVDGTSLDLIRSKKVPSDNTTGYRGVYLVRGKYLAKIVFQKKPYYLGFYDNIEEAVQVRKEAEEILFDGFAEHYEKWKLCAEENPGWAEENPVQVLVTQDEWKRLSVTFLPEKACMETAK